MKEIKLGDKVRDIHTGFEGVAVAKTEFINGCIQYNILPKCKEKGKMPEDIGIDSQSLEVIPTKKKKIIKKETGGAMNRNKIRRNF